MQPAPTQLPPPPAAAALQAPSASAALSSFDYPPVGAVTLAYPDSAIRDDRRAPDGSVPGFGQLHPRSQVLRALRTPHLVDILRYITLTGYAVLQNFSKHKSTVL